MHWKLILTIITLLILVIFVVQNYEAVEIKFLLWAFTTSKAIIIFACLCIGIIIGWTSAFMRKRDLRIRKG